jgi:Tripartite tricarboxylate transporter family receptor
MALDRIKSYSPHHRDTMNRPRRQFLHLGAGAVALSFVSRIARAQAYPTRPVRFVHGFAAGGSGDIAARLIAQLLSDRLGQQFIVENRTGAGGNIAVEAVARAPADGYTLLQLPDAFHVLDAWGFIYRTHLVWVKDRPGLGYWP